MCDVHQFVRTGWKGWPTFRSQALQSMNAGPWLDLSHKLVETDPSPPVFARPRYSRVSSMPERPLNVTEIQMVCHIGTHIDAPCHLLSDGPGFDEIPLPTLYGEGVVWTVQGNADQVVTAEELARMRPALRPGDVLLLDTGWASSWGTARYYRDDHLSLTPAAAEWLVAQEIKALGVDTPTPDFSLGRRSPSFDWPVHQVLLKDGRLIVKNVANLAPIAGRRIEVMMLGLNIAGADGSPARILARPIDADPI
jgi:arylformamidase